MYLFGEIVLEIKNVSFVFYNYMGNLFVKNREVLNVYVGLGLVIFKYV